MSGIAYTVAVILGGITLIAEAYRQFEKPVVVHAHNRFPVLRKLDISSLCSKSEYLRGFIIYVIIYLSAYAAFLTSLELYELLNTPEAGQKLAGAIGHVSPTGQEEGAGGVDDYGKPIFVSASIIFSLSSGLFAPIERYTRAFAHRLAGIPRGVYRIIGQLKRVDYEILAPNLPLPLSTSYSDSIEELSEDILKSQMIEETRNALRVIDILSPAVTGQLGDRIFTQDSLESVNELIDSERDSVKALSDRLSSLRENHGALEELHRQVLDTRDNLQALFAVLFIQSRSIALVSDATPTARIMDKLLERHTDPDSQSLAGALATTFVATIVIVTLADLLFVYGAYGGRTLAEVIAAEINVSIRFGLWAAVRITLMFLASAALAVIVRETRIDSGQWPAYTVNRLPFLRFSIAAIIPGIAAIIACFIGDIGEKSIGLLISSGTVMTKSQLEDSVQSGGGFYLMCFGWGFLISIFYFLVTDLHDELPARKTVSIALGVFALFAVWALVIVVSGYSGGGEDEFWLARIIKETSGFALPALIFFVTFALLLEWTEE
ncbi:hypothetical protein [Aliiroseovarius sp. YM-037]|uniref:hypothetical protein n=1 Tax=Aliiroseovarius sp. YM-037 TaxID=3341728 RepID=UPI003A808B22